MPAIAHVHLDDVAGTFDAAYLAMKATEVEQSARAVAGRLSPEGYVVTLQNGVVEDCVAGILGRERVVGALVVGWGATMHVPGVYEMTLISEVIDVAQAQGITLEPVGGTPDSRRTTWPSWQHIPGEKRYDRQPSPWSPKGCHARQSDVFRMWRSFHSLQLSTGLATLCACARSAWTMCR